MSAVRLDLSALQNACLRLAEGVARHDREPADAQLRDGLIQRFEFTYELSTKMLRRYLDLASDTPQTIDAMAFADIIRTAGEQGLLRGDWSAWKPYRDLRARTSHTYDEAVAVAVAADVPDFLHEAEALLQRLRDRTTWP